MRSGLDVNGLYFAVMPVLRVQGICLRRYRIRTHALVPLTGVTNISQIMQYLSYRMEIAFIDQPEQYESAHLLFFGGHDSIERLKNTWGIPFVPFGNICTHGS